MKLTITPTGVATADIVIDGINIADAVRGLTVGLQPDKLPRVILDLDVRLEPLELDNPRVTVPEQTVLALKALGWTPPDEAEVARQLLADAAKLLDALDLGVESDGISPLLSQIAHHLAHQRTTG